MLAAESPASFVAWDLLALGDEDLRDGAAGRAARPARDGAARRDAAGPPDARHARTGTLAADWFDRFEGAGLDGVVAKRLDGAYQPGKRAMLKIKHERTADCVVAGFRWHKNGPGTHVGSLLLGLFDDEGKLHHVGITSSFTWERARRAGRGARAAARERARGPPVGRVGRVGGAGRRRRVRPAAARRDLAAGTAARTCPGSRCAPERVVEVAYDHLQGDRFRHGDDVPALASRQAARSTAATTSWRPPRRSSCHGSSAPATEAAQPVASGAG